MGLKTIYVFNLPLEAINHRTRDELLTGAFTTSLALHLDFLPLYSL